MRQIVTHTTVAHFYYDFFYRILQSRSGPSHKVVSDFSRSFQHKAVFCGIGSRIRRSIFSAVQIISNIVAYRFPARIQNSICRQHVTGHIKRNRSRRITIPAGKTIIQIFRVFRYKRYWISFVTNHLLDHGTLSVIIQYRIIAVISQFQFPRPFCVDRHSASQDITAQIQFLCLKFRIQIPVHKLITFVFRCLDI